MFIAIALSLCAFWLQFPDGSFDAINETSLNDSDYGVTWMYIPDGNGTPQEANLSEVDPPTGKSASDGRSLVIFQLYTRQNKNVYSELVLPEEDTESNAIETGQPFNDEYFDPKKEIKIVSHGWMSSGESDSIILIKNAYLEDRDCNVIGVDWEPMSHTYFYFLAAYNTKIVGKKIAELINYLVKQHGIRLSQFHLIGHSLGAHVVGHAGYAIGSGKLPRITGLDPAGVGYENIVGINNRLDATDADFVDVIHTCGGVLGYWSAIGTADFYPNGGTPPQPGCESPNEIIGACSHLVAYKYFSESVVRPRSFLSSPCGNEKQARAGTCKDDSKRTDVLMGDSVSPNAYGVYYLITESESAYNQNTTN